MIVFFHILSAVMLVILGYFVKYRKVSSLIAGYNTASKDEKARYNVNALCNYIGNLLFSLAAIMGLISLVSYLELRWLEWLGWIVFIVVIFAAVVYANTGNRFKKTR